ncbi:MAG TPA: PEP-CTERM/exosortase system-associated acyltransferase [Stellaceae bacterium]|nr:PEP-CTERM/exosortase system-associated acyltransferase [Stellaceae bacterium]
MFEAVQADTPEKQRKAFQLRYQVYCVERNFLDPADNPDGLERDEYDDHAVQGVLSDRETGITVGTVRLVMHKRGARHGCLPIHKLCQDPLVHRRDVLPLETTCELSRFAISKELRRRVTDDGGREAGPCEVEMATRPWLPHITLGLIAVALQMGLAHRVDNVCAIMEPSLLRLVARLGFHFEPVGPLIPYHGWRQPCYAPARTLCERVAVEHPAIWKIITNESRLPSPHCGEFDDRIPRRPISIGTSSLRRNAAGDLADVAEKAA